MVKLSIFLPYPLGGPRNRAPLRDIKHLMINDSASVLRDQSSSQRGVMGKGTCWWESQNRLGLGHHIYTGGKNNKLKLLILADFPTTSHSFQPSKLTFWNMGLSWFPERKRWLHMSCRWDKKGGLAFLEIDDILKTPWKKSYRASKEKKHYNTFVILSGYEIIFINA